MSDDYQQSTSSKGGSKFTLLILLVTIILIAILIFGFLFNKSKIDQLTKSLSETQKQVQEVRNESEEAKKNLAEQTMSGLENIAGAIKDVKNPAVRLELIKLYAQRLSTILNQSDRADLDKIVVYIENNPEVLFTQDPNLPTEIQSAVNRLKTKVANLRNTAVATMQQLDESIYSPNEEVTLTGTIEFVDNDEVFGGSIFALTESSTGYVYYLHFNETNSENINENMIGQEVTLEAKVTSKANDPLTFQVISGPVLTSQAPSQAPTQTAPTEAPQPTQ